MTCQELIDAIRTFDISTLSDDDFLALETVFKDAVEGMERGLPLDPSKRPTREELLANLGRRLERSGVLDAPPKETVDG